MARVRIVAAVLALLSSDLYALLVRHDSPAPAAMPAPAPAHVVLPPPAIPAPAPISIPPLPAAHLAPAPAPALAAASGDCDPNGPLCQDVAKLREQQRLSQNIAIEQNVKDTTQLIQTEVARLVQLVRLSVKEHEKIEMTQLEQTVRKGLMDRVKAFTDAVKTRYLQVIGNEANQFAVQQEHEKKLLDAIALDLEQHGYQIAKDAVAREAAAAAGRFEKDPSVHQTLQSLADAGAAWQRSYVATEKSANTGLAAWSQSFAALNATWQNVTDTFTETNRAAIAARGLSEEQRWVGQTVRVAGDVVQTAQTQAQYGGAEENKVRTEVSQTEHIISGNSGSIETLTKMLEDTREKVQQAHLVK